MFKINKREVEALFGAIDLDYVLNTNEVQSKEYYESIIKIGTTQIDVRVEISLNQGHNITLKDVEVDFFVFNKGHEIKNKIKDFTHYLTMLEKLKNKIELRLKQ